MHLNTTGPLQADGCTSTHAFIGCSSPSALTDLVFCKKKKKEKKKKKGSTLLCSTGK